MTEPLSNPTVDVLLRRKSVRSYTAQPVSDEVKALILRAVLRAPTAGNQMLYTIIDVREQALKDRLAVTCDNQPFITTAPFLLLFLADYQRWEDYFSFSGVDGLCAHLGKERRHPEEGDLLLACCDALIAAHTAVVAAEALGLGSCYIGDIMENYEIHRQLFDLPRYVFPISLVCFGYPTEQQKNRPQPARFAEPYIIHPNRYRRLDPAQLEEMFRQQEQAFAARAQAGQAGNFGQAMYLRKFGAEFSIEMTRSVRAMLRAWRGEESYS